MIKHSRKFTVVINKKCWVDIIAIVKLRKIDKILKWLTKKGYTRSTHNE